MVDAKAGRLDLVLVWRADRLGRSLLNALITIADFDARGIQIVSLREGFDTKTPAGRLQMQIVLAFAEYELESIRERIKAGLSRARSQGTQLGRRRAIHPKSAAHDLVADASLSGAEVARRLGISKATVNNLRRDQRNRTGQQSPSTVKPASSGNPPPS
jgi:DNA invertase Pin-like site-specific DNA recombinase